MQVILTQLWNNTKKVYWLIILSYNCPGHLLSRREENKTKNNKILSCIQSDSIFLKDFDN